MNLTKKYIFPMCVILLFSGCVNILTPYDDEFTCQPSIIGTCSKNLVTHYKKTLNELDKDEK